MRDGKRGVPGLSLTSHTIDRPRFFLPRTRKFEIFKKKKKKKTMEKC